MNALSVQPNGSAVEATANGAGNGRTLGILFFAPLLAGLGIVAYRLYPEAHRDAANPSFIDNIFASNLVIFIARVMLLLGAGVLAAGMCFVVLSIWKRAQAGHYLARFGPFETQAIEDLRGELETSRGYWAQGNQKVDELNERIERSDVLIESLQDELFEANAVVKILREQAASR